MAKKHRPRYGSLQVWPRKRAARALPSVNWKPLEKLPSKSGLLGFVGYKAGMLSALVRDETADSLTKGKQIVLPATAVECPPMRVLSARFYSGGKVVADILVPGLEPELKRKLCIPKEKKEEKKVAISEAVKKFSYDNIRLIVYTLVKRTGIKKTPDITEIALSGGLDEKFKVAEELLGKEITVTETFDKGQLVDLRTVTKAKGLAGPVKRFKIGLKQYKSEKGIRRPGSLGPWTPKRVTFRAPMAGQLGFFTRVQWNSKVLDLNQVSAAPELAAINFINYGPIKTTYLLLKGSVGGPKKRAIFLTYPQRPIKKSQKQAFELIRLLK